MLLPEANKPLFPKKVDLNLKKKLFMNFIQRFNTYRILIIIAGVFYLGFGITLRFGEKTLNEIAFKPSIAIATICLYFLRR
jgi:hypothetical protein